MGGLRGCLIVPLSAAVREAARVKMRGVDREAIFCEASRRLMVKVFCVPGF